MHASSVSRSPTHLPRVFRPLCSVACVVLSLPRHNNARDTKQTAMDTPPSNKARDAKEIIANGYEAVDIQPFDLFPQTRHIENVVTFQDTRKP